MARALIILAAGQGTRMKSDLPKVLHPLAGAPLIDHTLRSAAALEADRIVTVVGPGMDGLADHMRAQGAEIVVQEKRKGTGHAVQCAQEALSEFEGEIFVLLGDTPVMNQTTLPEMAGALADADLVALGFETADPTPYGRFVVSGDQLTKIVEAKHASAREKLITLCNSGVFATKSSVLFDLVADLEPNADGGELYLTDIVEIAHGKGLRTVTAQVPQGECQGINSRAELAGAEARFQARARQAALDGGVTLLAPETVFFSHDTALAPDVVVEQNVVFAPGVTVAPGAHIRAFSHLEGAQVGPGAIVGPYARLRPGTTLENGAKVGNFVEVKAAEIGEGAKVNHLTYIGDASVGAGTNVGAGAVTCNYDGVMKHRTEIGTNAFIGTGTYLVAPVTVGDEAMTATGSVITNDVPDGAMAVGRARQENKPGLARKLFQKLRARKARQKKAE